MYKLIKGKGSMSNVFLRNTETNAELNLGRVTYEMISLVESSGFRFVEDDFSSKCREEWNFDIDEDTKKDFAKLAMKMTKPVRDQRKIKVESEQDEEPRRKDKQPVDVFSLIYGV